MPGIENKAHLAVPLSKARQKRVLVNTLNEFQSSHQKSNAKTVYIQNVVRNVLSEMRIFSVEKSRVELRVAIFCAYSLGVCLYFDGREKIT